MRVVHVVRQFRPAIGGMENAVYHLVREQQKLGVDVRVVTLDRIFHTDRVLQASEMIDGIEITRIPYRGSMRYPIAPSVIRHVLDADIVHVHGIDFFFDYLALTTLYHRRRLVVSTHGGFFHTKTYRRLKEIFFQIVTRRSLRRYALTAASSFPDAALFESLRSDGLRVFGNGVDVDKFSNIRRCGLPKQLIYFGRLAPNKNIKTLVHLLAAMRRADSAWRLVIAGRVMGTSPSSIMQVATELDVAEAVTVQDAPSDAMLRDLIQASSVFCSPSLYEGFGIACIEAMSAGLIVALSDIPAHRATIEATSLGFLVPFDEPEAAARAILAAYERQSSSADPVTFPEHLKHAYSWTGIARATCDAYKDILGQENRLILRSRVRVMTRATALHEICRACATGMPLRVAFLNAHLAIQAAQQSQVAAALDDFVLLNDGVGVDLASRALFRRRFPDNLNGTDFTPDLLDRLGAGCRIFLLGATADVIAKAALYYEARWPQHHVVGFQSGFFSDAESHDLAETIRASRADLVLVGMGCPRQENWLAQYIPGVCPVGIAVGALFDFQTGTVRRAPRSWRQLRLEWVYRLLQEPRRLGNRYVLGNATFVFLVARQWLSGVRA